MLNLINKLFKFNVKIINVVEFNMFLILLWDKSVLIFWFFVFVI